MAGTNVTFVNPDTTARRSVDFPARDGVTTADVGVFVPARGIAQLGRVQECGGGGEGGERHLKCECRTRSHNVVTGCALASCQSTTTTRLG